jgi:putative membrane protein
MCFPFIFFTSCSPDNIDQPSTASQLTQAAGLTDPIGGAKTALAMPGPAFADFAAAHGDFELKSATLALEKATSPTVKLYARRMKDEHEQSAKKLELAASHAVPPITLDPTPTAEQQAALNALVALPAMDFDRGYINAQIVAHETALSAFRAYAAAGDVPSLKAFAGEELTEVARLLELARALTP